MRFAVDGILVKSILVPLVDATAVPEVIDAGVAHVGALPEPADVNTCPDVPDAPVNVSAVVILADARVGAVSVLFVSVSVVAFPTSVSVAAGSVRVVVPATAVACTVVVPDVDPANLVVPASVIVLPDPTLRPTLVPLPAAANTASRESRSVLIFVPQVSVLAPTSGFVRSRFVVVVSAMMYLYAATCHVVALSEISAQVSLVSDTGVQLSDVSAMAVHVSDVSAIALHDSEVSGIAPHPKPMVIPTAPVAPLPIISIEMTFATVPTDPVPLTPVTSWNDMTSADTVPTDPVDAFPVTATDLVLDTVPGENVALLLAVSMDAL